MRLEHGHLRGGHHHGGRGGMRARFLAIGRGDGFPEGFAGGFGSRPGGGGRGGRRGRMFGPGELRLLLLHMIAGEQRHGYELIKAIEDLTGGHYAPSPGVVYPTLALLADEGLIAEVAGEGPRNAYAVTPAGREELAGRADEAAAIAARLTGFAAQRGREASPPVVRALANLRLALRQRAEAGLDGDVALQVADVLDDAARRIERL